ncbi:MAG: Crp/Fnr family transcriptional regulator [Chloroflexi bacterium]|nr:Crp/Fnr family transcriptional regulator [Chloroflexota bacterium]
MEDTAFLAKVPLFASLKADHLAELAAKLKTRNYRRGEVIFWQNDPASDVHIIRSGQVKISATSVEGEEIIMAILTPGDSFGEISLLDGQPRSASAMAMDNTQTVTLNRADFLNVMSRNPGMMGIVLASLAAGWRRTSHLLEDAMFLDIPGRLGKRLLQLAEKHGLKTEKGIEIDLHLTHNDLAAALGVSPATLKRHLRVLSDSGLIAVESRQAAVLPPDISADEERITILRPGDLGRHVQ